MAWVMSLAVLAHPARHAGSQEAQVSVPTQAESQMINAGDSTTDNRTSEATGARLAWLSG